MSTTALYCMLDTCFTKSLLRNSFVHCIHRLYFQPIKSALGNCIHSSVYSLLFSAVFIFLVIVLPSIGGLACIAVIICIISALIYCIYCTKHRETNAQGTPVVQPQQVVLYPVYAGPMPAATHYGTVQGQLAFIGSPYMQPASTAPPVPEHKDKPSSPSSEQQEDAPPSYDAATGGEP